MGPPRTQQEADDAMNGTFQMMIFVVSLLGREGEPGGVGGKMAGVRSAGKMGEIIAGIVKNTKRIKSASGSAKWRIPDVLNSRGRWRG